MKFNLIELPEINNQVLLIKNFFSEEQLPRIKEVINIIIPRYLKPARGYYPGLQYRFPPKTDIHKFFTNFAEQTFDTKVKLLAFMSVLKPASFDAEYLEPRIRPHKDVDHNQEWPNSYYGMVIYMFHDKNLGGTSFYKLEEGQDPLLYKNYKKIKEIQPSYNTAILFNGGLYHRRSKDMLSMKNMPLNRHTFTLHFSTMKNLEKINPLSEEIKLNLG